MTGLKIRKQSDSKKLNNKTFNHRIMKRSKELVEKRKDFVIDYVRRNQDKQMKVIVTELTEMLFLSERTIYNILLRPNIQIKFSLSV
jgi:hypothetical protein